MSKPKRCLICGEWFTPKSNAQRLCGKLHTRKCVVCGKDFVVKSSASPTKTCSRDCTARLREQTMMDRYGVAFSMQSDVFQRKSEETQLKKYGYKRAAQSPEIKEKTRQYFQEKFGVDNPLMLKEVRDKGKQTCLEKYGIENPNSLPEKQERTKQTNLRKYGVEHPLMNPEIHKAFTDKMYKKYGVPYYVMSRECIERRKIPIPRSNEQFGNILNNYDVKCEYELPIETYLYDLHVVGTNLLIEINPTSSHNVKWSPWTPTKGLPISYHVGKSKVALDHGYRCIHVWEWDDKKKLARIFFSKKNEIFARKCTLGKVNTAELHQFESENYLLNHDRKPDVIYGLYYNDELVYTMCFSKNPGNSKYEWELLRFCFDSRYHVVGGASKLFKYFISEHDPSSVVSFCDDAKFTGNVYKYFNMKIVGHTDPECIWGHRETSYSIPSSLLNNQNSNQLLKLPEGSSLNDFNEIDLDNSEDHTWLPVYNCGYTIFAYQK